MAQCVVDNSITRMVTDGFSFPLGVYPVEDMKPLQGYSVDFEPADGDDDEGDWEEWPDRYVFDIVISADRVEALCRSLFALLSHRVFPILDILGHDAFREIDPYIAYELVGLDRFTDAVRRYRGFLFEDGLVGFGALSEGHFFYVFVDEHKIVTLRAQTDLKEKVEKILAAFDLEAMTQPAGADAAAHEHRTVILAPQDRPELMTPDEIVDRLKEEWRLTLNIDAESNTDDEGEELGITCWRCLVLCTGPEPDPGRYAEILLTAGSLRAAEDLAVEGADSLLPSGREEWSEQAVILSDRVTPADFAELTGDPKSGEDPNKKGLERIKLSRWLE
jgi:hypothetical protein